MLVNGKKIAAQITSRLKRRVKTLKRRGVVPRLAILLVGNDPGSLTYVHKKQEAAKRIGVACNLYHLPSRTTRAQVVRRLQLIQRTKLSGVIVQLPLPKHLDVSTILNAIRPELDIDFLTYTNWGRLASGENKLEPPTPSAILEILRYHRVNLTGKHVVVVGRGWLIGKPLTNLLLQKPVTITVCGKSTRNLAAYTKQADILISAVGKYNLIQGRMVKRGAVVIDAGFSLHRGRMSGDVNLAEVAPKARLVTPTPGGVGPITVAKLLANTIANAYYLSK